MRVSPARPTRTTQEERLYRKQRLAGALRLFARLGFEEGAGRPHHGP